MLRLRTLLGDHAITAPLKRGDIASSLAAFDFADVKVPNTAFKQVVRDLEFDVAELAIVTYLMAKAKAVPLTLLPVVLMARFQHPFLVHDASRGALTPKDLEGRRVGVRSWTVTTAVWIRDVLDQDYGIDLSKIEWVTFEDAHVAGFADPPGVTRAAPGRDLKTMLLAGEIDAAVIPGVIDDTRIRPLLADPVAAARDWHRKRGAIQINHMLAMRTSLVEQRPDLVREVVRMLAASKRAAGLPLDGAVDLTPIGCDETRNHLVVAIDATCRQGLLPVTIPVDAIYDAAMRALCSRPC